MTYAPVTLGAGRMDDIACARWQVTPNLPLPLAFSPPCQEDP